MKKLISVLITMMLLVGTAYADKYDDYANTQFDFANMTDQELEEYVKIADAIARNAQAELDRRKDHTVKKIDTIDDYLAGVKSDEQLKQDVYDEAIVPIESFTETYKSCTLDSLSINVNYGTITDGDFNASVYMIYSIKTDSDKSMIEDFSEMIANGIAEVCPAIVEIAVFWDLEEYGINGRVSFISNGKSAQFDSEMLPLPDVGF